MYQVNLIEASLLLLCGGGGALVTEILDDNALQLPKIFDGKIFLGFIGSMIVGATVGLLVDHSYITAFFSGYTGFSAAAALIQKKGGNILTNNENNTPKIEYNKMPIEQMIRTIAKEYEINEELAVAVARCESGLNPKARNTNPGGSTDRGLYQINNKYHPEVSDFQADDPEFATRFFCKAVQNNNLSWWNASKKCWEVYINKKSC